MENLPSIVTLASYFSRLPGVGPKSAERMAYAVLGMEGETAEGFANAIKDAKSKISRCPRCGLYEEGGACPICDDPSRDQKTLMVVTSYKDALAIEKSGSYKGLYHLLKGTLSPAKGIYPEDLGVDELLTRINNGQIEEVIVATNPTIDGETTALYLARRIEEGGKVKVSRLAYGLSMGSSLEYSDALTLEKAIEGRKDI